LLGGPDLTLARVAGGRRGTGKTPKAEGFAHCRYVLIHNRQSQAMLEKLCALRGDDGSGQSVVCSNVRYAFVAEGPERIAVS
jgi:hypothetical protein